MLLFLVRLYLALSSPTQAKFFGLWVSNLCSLHGSCTFVATGLRVIPCLFPEKEVAPSRAVHEHMVQIAEHNAAIDLINDMHTAYCRL